MALFSFIQSLNTTFGTSIFEPVAVSLAKGSFKRVEKQAVIGNRISAEAQSKISEIINDLSTASIEPELEAELKKIVPYCRKGTMLNLKPVKVDLLTEKDTGELYLFDLKTAKPNASNFKDFKRTLLEWTAVAYGSGIGGKVIAKLAIPYNPYEPEPYSRWTMRGMIDLKNQIVVGKEFWDFLGGNGTYELLLGIFEQVGIELKPEIDARFARFK
jgi:hypothetical protein